MNKGKRIPTWVLVWLALLLFTLVIFLANRENIEGVLISTGFIQSNEMEEDQPLVQRPVLESPLDIPNSTPSLDQRDTNLDIDDTLQDLIAPVEEIASQQREPDENVSVQETSRVQSTKLYYITIHQNGSIDVQSISRDIPWGNTPLIQTINTLLQGPTPRELSQGLLNLIPPNTRLLTAEIRNEIAYLDFSEDFLFNPLGMEGYMAQIKQIVYTASQFSSVKGVHFKIENSFRDILGSEGLDISRPWTIQRLSEFQL